MFNPEYSNYHQKTIIDRSLLVSSIPRPDKKCLTFWGQKSLTLVKSSFFYQAIDEYYSNSAEAIVKKLIAHLYLT